MCFAGARVPGFLVLALAASQATFANSCATSACDMVFSRMATCAQRVPAGRMCCIVPRELCAWALAARKHARATLPGCPGVWSGQPKIESGDVPFVRKDLAQATQRTPPSKDASRIACKQAPSLRGGLQPGCLQLSPRPRHAFPYIESPSGTRPVLTQSAA